MQLTFTDNYENFFSLSDIPPNFPQWFFWLFFLSSIFLWFFANENWLIHCKYVHILPAVALEFIYTCSILLIGKTPVDTYAVIRFQTLIENK